MWRFVIPGNCCSRCHVFFFTERQSDVTACRQRAPNSGLRFDRSFSFRLDAGRQLIIRDLCVPSMHGNQRGFKSPVYRMNIEEQKKLLTMQRTIRSQLREGDRPWEGRLGESHQPMNKNDIRGRRGGTSWHNTAKSRHSAPEVNGVVGWRRFPCLPGEWERSGHSLPDRIKPEQANLPGVAPRESGGRPTRRRVG